MAVLTFAPAIQRHVPMPELTVSAGTVREMLDIAFAGQPQLRGYIVDDQGSLRRHVAIFVDGTMIRDRERMSDAVRDGSRVYVVQALSGG
ncbi:MoaD/ThiS family protein [Cupriavidus sp. AU9028]|uniref:MoaD/ThiS family protein n=1 Tax=Cupriavidus sp. AU9028 TaxID=2871157 RepID=UPI001C955721|nr:MoaD/ThiS family protein [Cupriavidus sp. AU9028]MBY4897701.1 MoaD/ThiS family protein [Cupriavidus sp. AU9028]